MPGNYRKITRQEACVIQGFPSDFKLPSSRARWMKLIGNSVAVNLIEQIARCVVDTGVFDERDYTPGHMPHSVEPGSCVQMSLKI